MLSSFIKYDFIEHYVHSAKMYTFWHAQMLGFNIKAYLGPETGVKNKVSYWLQKNDINLLFSSGITPEGDEIQQHLQSYGNGVKTIAIQTQSLEKIYAKAISEGLIPLSPICSFEDKNGTLETASFRAFESNQLLFVDRSAYSGNWLPGFEPYPNQIDISEDSLLAEIDHISVALRQNEGEIWKDYLAKIFNFDETQTFTVSNNEKSEAGIKLKVLQNREKKFTHVLVEPEFAGGNSQIQEFLNHYKGNGIQHIAFSTPDIFATIDLLKSKGVNFMPCPGSYYDLIEPNLDANIIDLQKIKKYGLLCDRTEDAYLLQIFTAPLDDRPTLFYEIVQRINFYEGFGLGNVSALMQSYNLEKAKRNQ